MGIRPGYYPFTPELQAWIDEGAHACQETPAEIYLALGFSKDTRLRLRKGYAQSIAPQHLHALQAYFQSKGYEKISPDVAVENAEKEMKTASPPPTPEAVAHLKDRLGLSTTNLALELGIHRITLARFLAGYPVAPETLTAIEKYLVRLQTLPERVVQEKLVPPVKKPPAKSSKTKPPLSILDIDLQLLQLTRLQIQTLRRLRKTLEQTSGDKHPG